MRTAILWTALLALASLGMLSCEITPALYTTVWTLEGIAEITAGSAITASVKLACYYTGSETDFGAVASPTLVSDVVDLGAVAGVSSPFTLNIYVSSLSPFLGDRIYLIMWEDTDGDSVYDAGDDWQNVEPQPGCPAFQSAILCYYIFDNGSGTSTGTETGWNQSIAFDSYTPVDDAVKSGALITNTPEL